MLDRDVVGGVHRIGEYFVNWYLVEEYGRLTVVDAGLTQLRRSAVKPAVRPWRRIS